MTPEQRYQLRERCYGVMQRGFSEPVQVPAGRLLKLLDEIERLEKERDAWFNTHALEVELAHQKRRHQLTKDRLEGDVRTMAKLADQEKARADALEAELAELKSTGRYPGES